MEEFLYRAIALPIVVAIAVLLSRGINHLNKRR